MSAAPAVALTLVTCPATAAETLARQLVEARVAACVNVLPGVRSVYRWQGTVEMADEALLLIKHSQDGFEALRGVVLAAHPYELPEIIAVPISQGHAPYLAWILASCTSAA